MNTTWFILALVAQIFWALGIFLDKYLLVEQAEEVNNGSAEDEEEIPTAVGMLIITSALLVGFVALSIFGYLVVQNGVGGAVDTISISRSDVHTALLIGFFEILWLIPYFYALDETDESVGPPVLQSIPVFGFVLGYFFFNEIPGIVHILAGIAIISGSLILNIQILKKEQEKTGFTIRWRPVLLMFLSAFIISALGFFFKDTAANTGFGPTAFWTAIGACFTGILIWIVVPKYRREFNAFIKARCYKLYAMNFLNEVLDDAAIFMYYAAITFGTSTALVQSTIAYQPLLILFFAFIFTKMGMMEKREKLSRGEWVVRILGISIICIGTILIFF